MQNSHLHVMHLKFLVKKIAALRFELVNYYPGLTVWALPSFQMSILYLFDLVNFKEKNGILLFLQSQRLYSSCFVLIT